MSAARRIQAGCVALVYYDSNARDRECQGPDFELGSDLVWTESCLVVRLNEEDASG